MSIIGRTVPIPVKLIGMSRPISLSLVLRRGESLTMEMLMEKIRLDVLQAVQLFGDETSLNIVEKLFGIRGSYVLHGVLPPTKGGRLVLATDSILQLFLELLEENSYSDAMIELTLSPEFKNNVAESKSEQEEPPKKRRRQKIEHQEDQESTELFEGVADRILSLEEAKEVVEKLGAGPEQFIMRFLQETMSPNSVGRAGYPSHEDSIQTWYTTRYLSTNSKGEVDLPWSTPEGMSSLEGIEKFYTHADQSDDKHTLLKMLDMQLQCYLKGFGWSHVVVTPTKIRCGMCGKSRKLNENYCWTNFVTHLERKHGFRSGVDKFTAAKGLRAISGMMTSAAKDLLLKPSEKEYPRASRAVTLQGLVSRMQDQDDEKFAGDMLKMFSEAGACNVGLTIDFLTSLVKFILPWESVGAMAQSELERRVQRQKYLSGLHNRILGFSTNDLDMIICQLSVINGGIKAIVIGPLQMRCEICKQVLQLDVLAPKRCPQALVFSWTLFKYEHYAKCPARSKE